LLLDHGVVVGGERKSDGVARIHLQAGICLLDCLAVRRNGVRPLNGILV
jgi:hypothetical protein